MSSQEALEIFDICNTIIISALLLITLPLAVFVYCKLLFYQPYSRNFTFKLIVFNGMTELLSCLSFLSIYQISTFVIARPWITFLQRHRKVGYAIRTLDYLLNGLALHSAFFVSLNRLKTMLYMKWKGNDASFVIASILLSFVLSMHRIIDLFCFTDQYYLEIDFGAGPVFLPQVDIRDGLSHQTLRTITDIETAVVSGSTLAVNLLLAILLTRRQNYAERSFKAEKGLVITSCVSFLFYTLYYINNCIARYLNINFFGYTQFLFLGLASMTPFWCLVMFATSIRHFAFRGLLRGKTHNINANERMTATFAHDRVRSARNLICVRRFSANINVFRVNIFGNGFTQYQLEVASCSIEMSQQNLIIFDTCSTIFIIVALVITLPLALFVYSKLLFSPPYSRNFSFKLIVFNGMTALLSSTSYLVIFQISSFGFANPFFLFLMKHRALDLTLRTLDHLLNGLALHTAFFVSLNRLKTLVLFKLKGNDATFVLTSLLISFILSSLRIIDLFCFSNQYFVQLDPGNFTIFYPKADIYDETLRTIANIETAAVCCSTLVVNLSLAFLLARRQNHAETVRMHKVERGLVITSIVSFSFYALSYVNSCIAHYTQVIFCAYAQFLFLGLASLTPFWCLIIFASSIRYFIIKGLLKSSSKKQSKNINDGAVLTATI